MKTNSHNMFITAFYVLVLMVICIGPVIFYFASINTEIVEQRQNDRFD